MAVRGRQGKARLGGFRQGTARQARRGVAGHGEADRGRQGGAWQGVARPGWVIWFRLHRVYKEEKLSKSQIDQFVENIVARAAGDLWAVALHSGMSLEEYERHVGVIRRGVEDGVRENRVRLLERIERKEAVE